MRNQVQLITYVDRLSGGGLASLRDLLRNTRKTAPSAQDADRKFLGCSSPRNAAFALLTGRLEGVFGGVHLLPFYYPIDGADAGFDPIDHTLVDPRLGTWADARGLSEQVGIIADLIVNHSSSESPQFQDVLRRGAGSSYAELFLTFDRVFTGGATE